MNEYNPIVYVWFEKQHGFAVDRTFCVETTYEELYIDNPRFKPMREMFTEALKAHGSFSPCDGVTILLCT